MTYCFISTTTTTATTATTTTTTAAATAAATATTNNHYDNKASRPSLPSPRSSTGWRPDPINLEASTFGMCTCLTSRDPCVDFLKALRPFLFRLRCEINMHICMQAPPLSPDSLPAQPCALNPKP